MFSPLNQFHLANISRKNREHKQQNNKMSGYCGFLSIGLKFGLCCCSYTIIQFYVQTKLFEKHYRALIL